MLLRVTCVVALLAFSTAAFAQGAPAAGAPANGPCKQIKQACEQAGFVKGGAKEGKGLMMNCMKPLLEGGAVAGVSVSSDLVAACKVKKAKHMEKKGKMGDMPQQPATPAPAAQ